MNTFDSSARIILPETIFRHMPEMIYWKDKDSIYLGCNESYANLLGLNSPQDIIGKTDYELGWLPDGDSADTFRYGDQETLAGRPITNQEEWLSVKLGKKILTLINKVPLVGQQGEVLGILGVAIDITEKKWIDADLTQAAHLKGMTMFGAQIAHELRTPLAAIKSFAIGAQPMLPQLIAAYRLAASGQLDVPKISETQLQLGQELLLQLAAKTDECNRIIDRHLAHIDSIRNTQKQASN
jgi:PAS domain S-box-containing protein